jgi:hypothetical protein
MFLSTGGKLSTARSNSASDRNESIISAGQLHQNYENYVLLSRTVGGIAAGTAFVCELPDHADLVRFVRSSSSRNKPELSSSWLRVSLAEEAIHDKALLCKMLQGRNGHVKHPSRPALGFPRLVSV